MKKNLHNLSRPRKGFTLLEALLLVVILGISGAAIGKALAAMTKSPEQNNIDLDIETCVLDKMEYLRSLPFSQLAADANHSTSVFSDNATIDGSAFARTVYIIYVNPANGTPSGSATHMLQISVSVGSKTVTTLENEP